MSERYHYFKESMMPLKYVNTDGKSTVEFVLKSDHDLKLTEANKEIERLKEDLKIQDNGIDALQKQLDGAKETVKKILTNSVNIDHHHKVIKLETNLLKTKLSENEARVKKAKNFVDDILSHEQNCDCGADNGNETQVDECYFHQLQSQLTQPESK